MSSNVAISMIDSLDGYVRIRRGIKEHFPKMGLAGTALYLYLHTVCDFRGGSVEITYQQIAEGLGCSKGYAHKIIDRLSRQGYVRVYKNVIQITKYSGVNGNAVSPGEQNFVSPGEQSVSPGEQDVSYRKQDVSPGEQSVSPGEQERLLTASPVNTLDPPKKLRSKKEEKKKEGTPLQLAFSGTHLRLNTDEDRLLGEAFQWVDRQAEYRKMDSWLGAHPEKRYTKYHRFAQNWMNKIPEPPKPKPSPRAQRPDETNLNYERRLSGLSPLDEATVAAIKARGGNPYLYETPEDERRIAELNKLLT